MHLFGELAVVAILCSIFIAGLQCRSVENEDDLTVLVDFIKYREIEKLHRHPRNADLLDKNSSAVCENPETEEFQKCGNNCILGCRYDNSSLGITLSRDECNETACVEGCFCKEGLIRHLSKCIPAAECPARKSKGIDILTNFENAPIWRHFPFFKPMSCQGSSCQTNQPSGCQGPLCGGGSSFGCGPKGCGQIYIYNHNGKPGCKDGHCESSSEENSDESGYSSEEDCSKHGSCSGSSVSKSNEHRPVVVHVHGGGVGSGSGTSGNKANNNNNNNNNNNPGNTNIITLPDPCQNGGCGGGSYNYRPCYGGPCYGGYPGGFPFPLPGFPGGIPYLPGFPGIGGGTGGGTGGIGNIQLPTLQYNPLTGGFTLIFPNGTIFNFSSGGGLLGTNLPGVNLPGGNLPGVNLPGGNLPGGNLPGVNLPGVNLSGVNLPGVNLPGGGGINIPGVGGVTLPNIGLRDRPNPQYEEYEWPKPPESYNYQYDASTEKSPKKKKKPSKKEDATDSESNKKQGQNGASAHDQNDNKQEITKPQKPDGDNMHSVESNADRNTPLSPLPYYSIQPAIIPVYYPFPNQYTHSNGNKKKSNDNSSKKQPKEAQRVLNQINSSPMYPPPLEVSAQFSTFNRNIGINKYLTNSQNVVKKNSNPIYQNQAYVAEYYDYLKNFSPNPSHST